MHKSVLSQEVVDIFANSTLHTFVDCTLGMAGHSLAIIKEHPELRSLIGIDQDTQAIEIAKGNLKDVPCETTLVLDNFKNVGKYLEKGVDGVLLDIGVSSMQLDQAARGFSFQEDGPLDMRMDQSQGFDAQEIINSWSKEDLADLFYEYGEERGSRRIAKAICEARKKQSFETTLQLASFIEKTVGRRGKIHPATRVFQALRIYVNDELGVLKKALQDLLQEPARFLNEGAIVAVITFHSLEDRIVKHYFKEVAKERPDLEILTKKPICPTYDECRQNRRARSAKLRAIKVQNRV